MPSYMSGLTELQPSKSQQAGLLPLIDRRRAVERCLESLLQKHRSLDDQIDRQSRTSGVNCRAYRAEASAPVAQGSNRIPATRSKGQARKTTLSR